MLNRNEHPLYQAQADMLKRDVVLDVKNLTVNFKGYGGLVQAVRGVNFEVHKGETVCIVGESGSGKSVTIKTVMGILAPNAIISDGTVMYEGQDLTKDM